MQVSLIQQISYSPQIRSFDRKGSNNFAFQPKSYKVQNANELNNQVSFRGLLSRLIHIKSLPIEHPPLTVQDYDNAVAYLQKSINNNSSWYKKGNILKADLDKLNGIQHGIKVFAGMSMKEIAFLYDNFHAIATNRGCPNQCAHCYAEAIPPSRMGSGVLSEMAFEDFKSLFEGISELNQRLGFNAIKNTTKDYSPLFLDSDCMNLEIKSEDNKILDFRHLNDLMFESTGIVGIFDTSGWVPTSLKHQKRAEDIVNYFLQPGNMDKTHQVNISLHPFHMLNVKSIEARNAGDFEKARKMRELYIDRMANVIFTFSPLMSSSKFNIMSRAVKDGEGYQGYNKGDLRQMINEIIEKVQARYAVECPEKAKEYSKYLKDKTERIRYIGAYGRGRNLFRPITDAKTLRKAISIERSALSALKRNIRRKGWYRQIDSNGEVTVTNNFHTILTPVHLNFHNKTQPTRPLPNQPDDFTITRAMIERAY